MKWTVHWKIRVRGKSTACSLKMGKASKQNSSDSLLYFCLGGLTIGLYGKNGLMRETAERFHEPATISCRVYEMNHSLLTTKNDSPFHHSFDTPSFAVECSKMFYSKSFQHVWNTVWVNFFAFFIRISPGELWGMGSVIQHKNWNKELTQPTYFVQYNYSYSIYYGDSQRFTAIG